MKPINESVQHVLREMGIISEGSQGAKRAMRKRVAMTSHYAGEGGMGYNPDKSLMSGGQIRRSLKRSFKEANQHNRYSGRVYHVVNATGRMNDLEKNLQYLFSGIRNEISVSTGSRDVWKREGIILSGQGKIRQKFDKDVYSIQPPQSDNNKIKNQGDYLIPTQGLRRSAKTTPWDESFMRLSDVKWDTMFISDDLSENDQMIAKEYAKKHDIEIRSDAEKGIQTSMDETRSMLEEMSEEIADSILELGGTDFKNKEQIIDKLNEGSYRFPEDPEERLKIVAYNLGEIIYNIKEKPENNSVIARLRKTEDLIYDHLSEIGEGDDEDYDDEDVW